ncbi:MAG: PASTA domain-containing protein [Bacteroidota bacterium]
MIKIGFNSWPDVIKHLSIVIVLGAIITLSFFYIYLPIITNHGESITVPDLQGLSVDELQGFLVDRDLRYEVVDSVYSADLPPLTVTRQFPKPGRKVKQKRKIFISLNSIMPPMTRMPDLIDKTIKNADLILKSYELVPGKITLEPDPFRNVLEQQFQGEPIEPNTLIPKGSVIDIVRGDGHGISLFEMPDLRGLPISEANVIIRGNNLEPGLVFNMDSTEVDQPVVIQQSPKQGLTVRVGRSVDLWIGNRMHPDLPDSLRHL